MFVLASWPAAAQDAEGPEVAEEGAPAAVISAFATCGTRYVTQRARTEPEKGFGPVDAGLRNACRRELQAYAAALAPPDSPASAVNAASRAIIAQHRRRFRTLFDFVSAAEVRRRQAEVATASAAASAGATEAVAEAEDDSPAETAVTVPTAPVPAPSVPPAAAARTASTRFIPLPPPRPRDLVPASTPTEPPVARLEAPKEDRAFGSHGATAPDVALLQGDSSAAKPAPVPPAQAHVTPPGASVALPPAATTIPLTRPAPADIATAPVTALPAAPAVEASAGAGVSAVDAPTPPKAEGASPSLSAALTAAPAVPLPSVDTSAQGWQRAPISIGGTGVIDVELPPFPTAPPAIAARSAETSQNKTTSTTPTAAPVPEPAAPVRIAQIPASAAAAGQAAIPADPVKSSAAPASMPAASGPPPTSGVQPPVRDSAAASVDTSGGVTRVSRRTPTTEQLRQLDAAIGQHRVCLARAVLSATGGATGQEAVGSVLKACADQQEARVARELEADGQTTPDMAQRVRQDVANVARTEATELIGLLRGTR